MGECNACVVVDAMEWGNIGMNGTESPNVRPYEPTGEGRMRENNIMVSKRMQKKKRR